MASIDVKTSF